MDEAPAPDVDSVVMKIIEEDDVARLEPVPRDGHAVPVLPQRAVGKRHAHPRAAERREYQREGRAATGRAEGHPRHAGPLPQCACQGFSDQKSLKLRTVIYQREARGRATGVKASLRRSSSYNAMRKSA